MPTEQGMWYRSFVGDAWHGGALALGSLGSELTASPTSNCDDLVSGLGTWEHVSDRNRQKFCPSAYGNRKTVKQELVARG